jgi:soluble lytic murein transglycosylase
MGVSQSGVSAAFYAGLRAEAGGDAVLAASLYEKALASPSGPVKEAALDKLIGFLTASGEAFSPAGKKALAENIAALGLSSGSSSNEAALARLAAYFLGRHEGGGGDSPWERALTLAASFRGSLSEVEAGVGEGASGAALEDFFFTGVPGPAQIWLFGEWEALAGGERDDGESAGADSPGLPVREFLSEAQSAAIRGRLAILRAEYGRAMAFFETVLDGNPGLFLRYPELLGDLGRAFQYSGKTEDGAERFAQWDNFLETGTGLGSGIFSIDAGRIRYILLYYWGRIERQRQNYAGASGLFTRALALAPDSGQEDACIWYILNLALNEQPEIFTSLVEEYAPRWNDGTYFADILDRNSQRLSAAGQREELYRVFTLIRERAGASTTAQYAYILGRAAALGFLKESPDAEELFRTAFAESAASFYYRGLSASFLGESVDPIPAKSGTPAAEAMENWEALDFLLDFFRFDCGEYAYSYAQKALPDLSIAEIRFLAEAFAGAGRWGESIRIISAGVSREGYEIERRDMELLYPRPFTVLIEKNALRAELPREILFGLIRTESFFFPEIVSGAGAVGLAQLMPATALDMAGRIARQGGPDYIKDGTVDLKDPETNVHLGAWYLNYLIRVMESPVQALIAYNGGIGRVRRWRGARPELPEDLFLETIEFSETREYGRRVLAAATAYGYLYYGLSMEGVIADIYRGL